ncbi:MAG TPA: phosphoribosyltransferase family protein [Candidatus Binatia bacterium]|nr:phosphoribosyltransferase family protein [Candidatus Binatia bacterium]
MFRDREEAARQLAAKLAKYCGARPLVLGIPRGAVVMAAIIANRLDGDLDVALVRKLGAPGQPELAVGAVDETGRVTLDGSADELGLDEAYLERERDRQAAALRARRTRYTPARASVDPAGRTVIVVDDGIATGATLAAALRLVRSRGPARLVAAAAVAPPPAVARIEREADEVVVLATPEPFTAVGAFFDDFRQVSDDEVVELLERFGSEEP